MLTNYLILLSIMQILHISPVNSAAEIPQAMQDNAVTYHVVNNVNWPDDYPYCPKVEVALAHDGKNILVHYRVNEQSVRAVADHDNGDVWEDACCELFISPNPSDGIYYNIECNCAGTILLGQGTGRNDRTRAEQEVMSKIDRWTTFPLRSVFEEKPCDGEWQLALRIPAECLFKHNITDLSGMKVRINVYKCGDKLSTPHFISLFPIDNPTPNFHLPEFFGEAELQK